jgi:NAD(P)H dehydrogenase (quinone)
MKVFIVHAHHEPKSFNGALTEAAIAALMANGHETCVSDLYAMGFDRVSDRRNFTATVDGDYLKQQGEEAHATSFFIHSISL